MKDQLSNVIERIADEWLRFLVFFFVGLFILPFLLSVVTQSIDLEQFYSRLFFEEQFSITTLFWVFAPYLIYLLVRRAPSSSSDQ